VTCLALAWSFGKSFTKRKDFLLLRLFLFSIINFKYSDDPYPGYTDRIAVAMAVKNGVRPVIDHSVPSEIKG
jgi:hypothetical protein